MKTAKQWVEWAKAMGGSDKDFETIIQIAVNEARLEGEIDTLRQERERVLQFLRQNPKRLTINE